MCIKKDHMQNEQLKSGYKAQISTENHIIVNKTMQQNHKIRIWKTSKRKKTKGFLRTASLPMQFI